MRLMIFGMKYGGNAYRTLKMNIDPRAEFNQILAVLSGISFIGGDINQEHVIYAILELINNSLRAHREKLVERPIHLRLTVSEKGLSIVIRDFGGGFDPKRLPFDIDAPVSSVDTNNESFQKYREGYGYKRFGIGLYIARKIFHSFKIFFFNSRGESAEYEENSTDGTQIEMMEKWSSYD